MIVTCHCKTLESSTKPAEKPSIGFRVKSVLVLFIVVVVLVVLIRRVGERERGKSQYKMLESPRRSPRKNHHRPHHNHHHRREKETDRQNKTKETMKTRKTTLPLSWFLNKSTAWSVILFSSLFSRLFFKRFIIYHTKTTERSNTNFFGDESLRRLVFNIKSYIIIRLLLTNRVFVAVIPSATTTVTTAKSICLCKCKCVYMCVYYAASCSFFPLLAF